MATELNKNISQEEVELLKKKLELLEKEVELSKKAGSGSEVKEETDEQIYKKSKSLYKWVAPMRIYIPRSRRWFVGVGLIALILVFFLVIVDKPLLIAVILATLFLVYVLATTKPDNIEHEITNKGIYTLKKLYKWSDLVSYWFVKRDGRDVLYVDTNMRFTPRLIMLVGEGSVKELNNLLQEHIPYFYMESQGKLGITMDGEYVPAEKLPGKKPPTNKGEK